MTTVLSGLVLAGGFSRRMGQDKALMDYHGQPQVAHVHQLMSGLLEDVRISCREGQLDLDLPQLHDREEGLGPMGGMLRAFEEKPDSAWLVIACDLPLLSQDVLEHLIASRNPSKLATAYRDPESGLPEPLCAIYEPSSVTLLKQWMDENRRCPRKLLIVNDADVNLLDLPSPKALDNANAPDDVTRLQDQL